MIGESNLLAQEEAPSLRSRQAQKEFNLTLCLCSTLGYLRKNPKDPREPTIDFPAYTLWALETRSLQRQFADAKMVKAIIVSSIAGALEDRRGVKGEE